MRQPIPKRVGKLESRDFFLISRSRWFAEKMIDASPFSSLEVATSFARQLWFKESRIQSWLDAFSGHSRFFRAIHYAPASMMRELLHWDRKYRVKFWFEFITSTKMWESQKILDEVKVRYENTLVVELDIAARKEFKLIEHGLERLWERLSRTQIQEASEETGEVVPDSVEKEAVVSSESSEEADPAEQKASMLSYDLNKMPDENEYPYSRMSPDKKNAWHQTMRATRYLNL
ncbi:hypothetical protein Ahy_A07g033662 [Arachis hypogaea]|uniref:Oxo-4-hydroxy-4-carboxy-5-ureidoimidazoline decarboxylase domain-containing protein n=1 Tax=Arachis hypogaea TaxID=3818 RepID=A0A445CA55_ARAHY|nr:hypothetical protein Ahy_A07g033662 [Arachis hypogaea]